MKTDLYTKIILTVIAFALLLIAIRPIIGPKPAQAQGYDFYFSLITARVGSIESDLRDIALGRCKNSKIC